MVVGVLVGDLFGVAERRWTGRRLGVASGDDQADDFAGVGGRATRKGVRSVQRVTGKRLGEIAEAAFLAKASALGFGVAKPWGDSDRYDFILDASQIPHEERSGFRLRAPASLTPAKRLKLWRVQVKSAHRMGKDRGYSFRAHGHSSVAYREDEIDALVAYIVPEDAWYVFPAEVFGEMRSLKLFPCERKRSRYEKYREAWEIFRRPGA